MDENPYQAPRTPEVSFEPIEEETQPGGSFGFLILGAIGGACVGGLLASVLMKLLGRDDPATMLGQYSWVPVACVTPLACIGAFFGWWCEERWRSSNRG